MSKIFTWSYSKWGCFNQCKFKFDCRYNKKLPDPSGPAAARGTELHLKGEHYLKGDVTKLPKEWEHFKTHMAKLKKMKALPEEDLSVTKTWKPTKASNKNAWCRAFADANVRVEPTVALTIDYKTGKVYADKHQEQGELYGMLKLLREPDLEVAEIEFWYLDQGGYVAPYEVTQDDIPDLRAMWLERVAIMESTKTYPPTEQFLCRYCNYARAKGGPCKRG